MNAVQVSRAHIEGSLKYIRYHCSIASLSAIAMRSATANKKMGISRLNLLEDAVTHRRRNDLDSRQKCEVS